MTLPQGCLVLGVFGDSTSEQGTEHPVVSADILGPPGQNTTCVRFWAAWPSFQPTKPPAGEPIATTFANIMATQAAMDLDNRVQAAKNRGLTVIVTSFLVPLWANGNDQCPPFSNNPSSPYDPDKQWYPQERFTSQSAWSTYVPGVSKGPKPLNTRFPTGTGTSDPWGTWMAYLNARYGSIAATNMRIDYLEPLNEPNWMMWPQYQATTGDPNVASTWNTGTMTSHCIAAEMIQTAQSCKVFWSGPKMLVPASHDTAENSRHHTPQATFDDGVLSRFSTLGFTPGTTVGWSVHNYGDSRDNPISASRLQATVNRIRLKWDGLPNGARASAEVFVTEGGWVRSGATPNTEQATRMFQTVAQSSWIAGVAMLAQYLDYTDTNSDSGLRDPPALGGAARNALSTWQTLHGVYLR